MSPTRISIAITAAIVIASCVPIGSAAAMSEIRLHPSSGQPGTSVEITMVFPAVPEIGPTFTPSPPTESAATCDVEWDGTVKATNNSCNGFSLSNSFPIGSFRVPADASIGKHTVTVTERANPVEPSPFEIIGKATFVVLAALPRTGTTRPILQSQPTAAATTTLALSGPPSQGPTSPGALVWIPGLSIVLVGLIATLITLRTRPRSAKWVAAHVHLATRGTPPQLSGRPRSRRVSTVRIELRVDTPRRRTDRKRP